jgi:hypothetical protein
MRKLALVVLVLSGAAGGLWGCGGSSSHKLTGAGGTGGSDAGMTGTGGSTAGSGGTSAAGSGGDMTGVAGADAGAGGAAGGVSGAGGSDAGAAGAAGAPPPPAPYCDTHPQRQLPYTIATDFKVIHILSNNDSAGYWKNLANADCSDNPVYQPFPSTGGSDGGADAAGDAPVDAPADGGATDAAASDAPDATATLELDVDAGDGGVVDAAADAPVEASADGPGTDAPATDGGADVVASNDGGSEVGTDAGPPLPACYEFSYDPDGCTGTCWAGVVFEVTDVQGPSPDTKGVCIQHGAMGIEFWARASKNNANVKFGSIGEGVGATEFYTLISTTWTRYFISIPAMDQQTYDETAGDMQGVWNALSIVVDPTDHAGGTYIEVKDIHWITAAQ